MIPPTLDLDITTKHTELQTLARQDKERQGEETCQESRTHSALSRTRACMHMQTNQSYEPWGHLAPVPSKVSGKVICFDFQTQN